MAKRYVIYILIVALLLLLGGSVVMACNNCSSHEWTVLEIRSQEDLAMVLEQVNLSEVQVPSENLSVLGMNGNGTAYLLIPALSQDPCDQSVTWSCLSASCPKECPYCYQTAHAWSDFHGKCIGFQHVCCPTKNYEIWDDVHYDSDHVKHTCKACGCL